MIQNRIDPELTRLLPREVAPIVVDNDVNRDDLNEKRAMQICEPIDKKLEIALSAPPSKKVKNVALQCEAPWRSKGRWLTSERFNLLDAVLLQDGNVLVPGRCLLFAFRPKEVPCFRGSESPEQSPKIFPWNLQNCCIILREDVTKM